MPLALDRILRRKVNSHAVEIESLDDVGQVLHWAEPYVILQMRVPLTWLRMQGAFPYAGGFHPFVDALRSGREALEAFYSHFQPSTLAEMYDLDQTGEVGEDLPPWELPWLMRRHRKPPTAEAGLGSEHGVSFYGPATPAKIDVEMRRLNTLRDSIVRRGYDLGEPGGIAGCFLRNDQEVGFYVRGGKHRAAVLAHLGHEHIWVHFRRNWPRLIDVRDIDDWPLVQRGQVSPALARRVFDSYFERRAKRQLAGRVGV